MTNLAIFASGNGSNAIKIIEYFENNPHVKVRLIATDNPEAGIRSKAAEKGVPVEIMDKTVRTSNQIVDLMFHYKIDFIILAGYLKLITPVLIHQYPEKIVNIHPALLPKHGGKGMFGMHVHQAVALAKDAYTGITIHVVNEQYDKGRILFQKTFETLGRNATQIAEQIHQVEHQYFAPLIEAYIRTF